MELTLLADGFGYVESPRWHRGRLWFSDFDRRQVMTLPPGEGPRVFADVPGKPSGIAFTDDSVLVASMTTQEILSLDAEGSPTAYADLSHVAVGVLNDMTMAPDGTLFVGCFGYDLEARERPRPGPLLAVRADGSATVACPDITFANGMVVSDDGATLLVAETPLCRITSFRIAPDGSLADRRTHADLGRLRQPDGLCLDGTGGLWVGSPFTEELLHLSADGIVTHVITTPGRWAVAPALGGPDESTLFVLTAETDLKRFAAGVSRGRVETISASEAAGRN